MDNDSQYDGDSLRRKASNTLSISSDSSAVGTSLKRDDELYAQEELIISTLSQSKSLLVFDHFNSVSASSATDIKIFLSRLLDRCKQVKVMSSTRKYLQLYKGFSNLIGIEFTYRFSSPLLAH